MTTKGSEIEKDHEALLEKKKLLKIFKLEKTHL
jgi:hypothetical protein